MRYWFREAVGWLLVALGLYTFYLCFDWLRSGAPAHAAELTVIGFVIFRGGIHLLKMMVAARVALEAQEGIADRPAAPNVRVAPAARAGRPAVTRQRP
jgi:hypothetical protein